MNTKRKVKRAQPLDPLPRIPTVKNWSSHTNALLIERLKQLQLENHPLFMDLVEKTGEWAKERIHNGN